MEQINTNKRISPYVAAGLVNKNEYGIGYRIFKKREFSVFQEVGSIHFIHTMENLSGYTMNEFCRSRRRQEFTQIRHILRYFLHNRLGISLKRCMDMVPSGRGANNHTTAINSMKVVRDLYLDNSPTTDAYVLYGRKLYREFQQKIQFENS